MKKALLVIDPQKDFIDSPEFKGALAVPGAYDDMKRLAVHIEKTNPNEIIVTMDTHEKMHIANPMWWVNEKGENPSPFTLITVDDVLNKKWIASQKEKQDYSLYYVKELAKNNKYVLCIWPYHCINGTEGHKISEVLVEPLKNWESLNGKKVQYIFKGKNPNTEHYSGLKAEVIIDSDPETELNLKVINYLKSFDEVEVCGEAKSHCVASTANDLIDGFGTQSKKITILEDCMSSVPGFDKNGEDFVEYAKSKNCSIKRVQQKTLKP